MILKPPVRFESRTFDWKFNASTTRIIRKTYLKCYCIGLVNIKQILDYSVAIDICYALLPISSVDKVLQWLSYTGFFISGTKRVVAGRVRQVFVLYSNGSMRIGLGDLSIGRPRRVVVLQRWPFEQV